MKRISYIVKSILSPIQACVTVPGMGSITHDRTNYYYFHMLSYQLQLHQYFLRQTHLQLQ